MTSLNITLMGDIANVTQVRRGTRSAGPTAYPPTLEHTKRLQRGRPYQCSRRACRKAESPSMMRRMATVRTANMAKIMKTPTRPPQPLRRRPMFITMVHSTSDSSARGKRNSLTHGALLANAGHPGSADPRIQRLHSRVRSQAGVTPHMRWSTQWGSFHQEDKYTVAQCAPGKVSQL